MDERAVVQHICHCCYWDVPASYLSHQDSETSLLQALWRRHTNTPSSRRHLYEVVQAGCPCHLYFDLEFAAAANPGVCGDSLVNVLVGLVREEYARLWGIDIRKQVGV
jgi:hypothetical protein